MDTTPATEPSEKRVPVTTPLIVVASLIVIVAGLRAAAGFLVPIISAILLTLILAPGVVFLTRKRMPKGLAIGLVTLLVIAVGAGVGIVVGDSLVGFTRELPARVRGLEEVKARLFDMLVRIGVQVPTEDNPLDSALDTQRIMGLFTQILGAVRSLVANGFIIVMLVVFGLLQIGRTRAMVDQALGPDSKVHDVLARYSGEVFEYLRVKSLMSLGTGICVGIALTILGIDYAVLWGLLAFLLNFIPNIGSLIAAVPPVALGLLDYGLGRAIAVAACIIAINMTFSNFLEPRLMGRSFGISPWMVFVALLFWAYVLGPVGMILAIPLTVALKLGLEMSDRTKWLAALMA
ncbi:MAG: AI-2E family transporter [Gemmatimonadota bacterium]|nr:AI-2E family transporter [Gemmatimonadota bacterium]